MFLSLFDLPLFLAVCSVLVSSPRKQQNNNKTDPTIRKTLMFFTSQMDLNILNGAVLLCKLQCNTKRQIQKANLLCECIHG